MKRFMRIVITVFVLLVGYLLIYPTGLQLGKWSPALSPELTGQFEKNSILSSLEVIHKGNCNKCEDIAIDSLGNLYGGEINGNIKFFDSQNGSDKVLTNTEGRPLGLHFDDQGNLIIADADKGMLSLSTSGELSTLTSSYNEYVFKFADDLEIDSNGIIYFSDASDRFGFHLYPSAI